MHVKDPSCTVKVIEPIKLNSQLLFLSSHLVLVKILCGEEAITIMPILQMKK